MLRILLSSAFAALLAVGSTACSKKKPEPKKPGELSTQELNKLKDNALKAYGQIVKDYPDSPHAAKAKERIEALKPPAGKK
jgi:hypothetical protein